MLKLLSNMFARVANTSRLCCAQLTIMWGQTVYSPLASCVGNRGLFTRHIVSAVCYVVKLPEQADVFHAIVRRFYEPLWTKITDEYRYLSTLSTPPTITTTKYINI